MKSSTTDMPGTTGTNDTPTPVPSDAPSEASLLPPREQLHRVLTGALWGFAVFTVLHRLVILAVNGHRTNDFLPVYTALQKFLEHRPVYDEDFSSVNPHYLYSPSGTLLLSPIALVDNMTLAKLLFASFNATAMILAAVILVRLFSWRWSGPALPGLILVMFLSEGVTNTVVFGNVNGVILLCEVLFFALLLRDTPRAQWLSGLPLGLALSLKPILLPLLVLPLFQARWRPFVGALTLPVATNLLALPLLADPGNYFTRTLPYLREVRDYFNNSLAGQGLYWGMPEWTVLGARLAVAVLTLLAVWLLLAYRESDPLLWMTTTSGVLLVGTFLVGSLGQMYYSLLLFPMLITVLRRGALVTAWPLWIGVYLVLSYDYWYSQRWVMETRWFEGVRGTVGWLLIFGTLIATIVWRNLTARQAPRPDVPHRGRIRLLPECIDDTSLSRATPGRRFLTGRF